MLDIAQSQQLLVIGNGIGIGEVNQDRDGLIQVLALGTAPGARVLVLSLLGAHPDARAKRLKALWELEELVRGTAIPNMTLRLAPLVGPLERVATAHGKSE